MASPSSSPLRVTTAQTLSPHSRPDAPEAIQYRSNSAASIINNWVSGPAATVLRSKTVSPSRCPFPRPRPAGRRCSRSRCTRAPGARDLELPPTSSIPRPAHMQQRMSQHIGWLLNARAAFEIGGTRDRTQLLREQLLSPDSGPIPNPYRIDKSASPRLRSASASESRAAPRCPDAFRRIAAAA